jgi:small redox-active disulfide protein 2
MIIKILGTGCAKCKKLENNAKEAVKLSGKDAEVEKVTEMDDIIDYGVMMTPGLVIDEKVVSTGKVLSIEKIREMIK